MAWDRETAGTKENPRAPGSRLRFAVEVEPKDAGGITTVSEQAVGTAIPAAAAGGRKP